MVREWIIALHPAHLFLKFFLRVSAILWASYTVDWLFETRTDLVRRNLRLKHISRLARWTRQCFKTAYVFGAIRSKKMNLQFWRLRVERTKDDLRMTNRRPRFQFVSFIEFHLIKQEQRRQRWNCKILLQTPVRNQPIIQTSRKWRWNGPGVRVRTRTIVYIHCPCTIVYVYSYSSSTSHSLQRSDWPLTHSDGHVLKIGTSPLWKLKTDRQN